MNSPSNLDTYGGTRAARPDLDQRQVRETLPILELVADPSTVALRRGVRLVEVLGQPWTIRATAR